MLVFFVVKSRLKKNLNLLYCFLYFKGRGARFAFVFLLSLRNLKHVSKSMPIFSVDDRYRGDRMRSPPIRGSGAYQPPASSDRYRPPVGGRDGGDSMRRGGPPPSEDIRRGGGGGRDSEDRDRDLFRRRGGDDEFRRGGGGAEDS